MRSARVAEWILSQVLPPDRAASTVGDWMEDVDKRGDIWFWSCVFRTLLSRIGDDFTGNLAATARIGLLGFARSILMPIGTSLLVRPVVMSHYRYLFFTEPSNWQIALTIYLAQTWWYFHTGRWVARRSSGRELASCLAVSLVGWALVFARLPWIRHVPDHYVMLYVLPAGIAHDLILLAGVLLERRMFARRLAQT